jgi:hypothetical protein
MLLHTREMGCTPEDLLRWLPKALDSFYPQTNLTINGSEILSVHSPRIELQALTLQSRKIALLSIPILELRMLFDASFSSNQIEMILGRFDLYTRRGGG